VYNSPHPCAQPLSVAGFFASFTPENGEQKERGDCYTPENGSRKGDYHIVTHLRTGAEWERVKPVLYPRRLE